MIALFSALLVLMIRKGKIKQALEEVNEYATLWIGMKLMGSKLLDWPYSDDPKIRSYAKMLGESYEAMQREEDGDADTPAMAMDES